MKNLAKAIVAVTKAVKGVEKSLTVGSGNYAYQGVSDYEVKKIFNKILPENGLSIIPISIEPKVTINRWEERDKQKQSVFTEVKTKYLLLHESGESVEVSGYGQGVDTQDKSAGKATTYALKYALLYAFLVPTGKIDDTDASHSEEIEIPSIETVEKQIKKTKSLEALAGIVDKNPIWKTNEDILTCLQEKQNELIAKIKEKIEGCKNLVEVIRLFDKNPYWNRLKDTKKQAIEIHTEPEFEKLSSVETPADLKKVWKKEFEGVKKLTDLRDHLDEEFKTKQ